VAAAKLLLAFGADKNIKDTNGLTPLAKAKKEGKREMIFPLEK
jgi:ankyrin repeat protein